MALKVNDRSAREEATLARAARILEGRLVRQGSLDNPGAMGEFLRMRLAGLEREAFFVLYLDGRLRILGGEVLAWGTIDGAEVHPREVVKLALRVNASAVVCAHNHPSQVAEPSAADRAVTARLKQALALVDVRLLDHFVVTAGGCTSLAARGWV